MRFRFGLFELDTETLELRREGTIVRLQAQPAQALLCLVENADRIVTRDELRNAVWKDGTFVDFERGLNFCISQIRSALRDDPSRPVYIQTVPKQGYRLIAPVTQMEAGPLHSSAASEHSAAPGQRRALLIGICLSVVATGGLLFWVKPSAAPIFRNGPLVAVTRFDNETGDPALTRFSDALTDNLVEQLTIQNQNSFGIIGNANILRRARELRDLREIGNTLHVKYVVLGQVQRQGSRTRILAHLIRLPEQTHLWVVRIDGSAFDPVIQEADAAQKVAVEFSKKLAADKKSSLPPYGSN
jgi:DNA-binding winged helix-turn-helix (wHTH) protein/TolB-like protein